MTEITFLGTTCMIPTKERNHVSIFLRHKGFGILVDCGEGTQRQLRFAKIKPTDVNMILISHWHGDHVLGIPGLLQTLNNSNYTGKLHIYGPQGTKEKIQKMYDLFSFDNTIEIIVTEITKKKIFENEDFYIEAYKLEHNIPTFGFNFIEKDRRRINLAYIKKLGIPEGPLLGDLQKGNDIIYKGKKISVLDATRIVKGKKISIVMDTVLCKAAYEMAENADILISEAAYTSKLEEKALEYQHMTAKQAALLASKSGAKKLILFHFSQRYKTTDEIIEDAKDYFENVDCAYDLMKIKI